METTATAVAKPTTTDNTIKVINAIFGTAHLFFQTAADLTAEAEGRLVQKVSKGAITKDESIQHRKNATALKQQQALNKIAELRAKKSNTQTIDNESHS